MTSEETQQRQKFKGSLGCAKIIALIMLILSEYLFLSFPICRDDDGVTGWIYPYVAFSGTVLISFTYAAFIVKLPNCEVFVWTIVEFATSITLFTVMILACNETLWECSRPMGWSYFLPEIIGLAASTILLIHSIVWIVVQRADQINDAVKMILV